MSKKHEYRGQVFDLDDSKGCYLEVDYQGQTAYVGVNLGSGTNDSPYTFDVSKGNVSDDGLHRNFGGGYASPNDALNAACGYLYDRHKEAEGRKSFDPEDACKNLHEFFDGLPG